MNPKAFHHNTTICVQIPYITGHSVTPFYRWRFSFSVYSPFQFFSSGERLQKWRKPWFGTEKKHKDVKICMIKFIVYV